MLGNDGYQEEGFIHYLKDELLKLCNSESLISDILTEYFYINDSAYKVTLWSAYGKYMYKALEANLGKSKLCENCDKRFDYKTGNQKLCEECTIKVKKQRDKEKALRYYHKKNKTLPS